MQAARDAGLVSVGKTGPGCERPLLAMERAALILVAALCAGTSLTIVQAADLVAANDNWRRGLLAAALTGEDLTLYAAVNRALKVTVTIPHRVLRGLGVGRALAEAA